MGPILFNIFVNDLLMQITTDVYNYEDDNTLASSHRTITDVISTLEKECVNAIRWFSDNQMCANPNKCQSLILGHHGWQDIVFNFEGVQVVPEECVTLLGVNIDCQLNFDIHISEICKKGAKQINVLGRLSRLLDTQSKLVIYRCFIMSLFNYCTSVWFFCSKSSSLKLEKIQERALRFVFNDKCSSYDDLMKKADAVPVRLYLMSVRLLDVFKIVKGYAPLYLSDIFRDKNVNYELRDGNILDVPRFNKVMHGHYSLGYMGAKMWNHLPTHFKTTESINGFKNKLKTWYGCDCGLCKAELYY